MQIFQMVTVIVDGNSAIYLNPTKPLLLIIKQQEDYRQYVNELRVRYTGHDQRWGTSGRVSKYWYLRSSVILNNGAEG